MAKHVAKSGGVSFDLEKYAEMVKSTEIAMIRIRDSACHVGELRSAGETAMPPDKAQHTMTVEIGRHKNNIRACFFLAVKAAYPDQDLETLPKEKLPVFIEATFEAFYAVKHQGLIENHYLFTFGQTIGLQNVWPYWREFVHTMTMRMALPPLIVPLVKAQSPPKRKPVKKRR